MLSPPPSKPLADLVDERLEVDGLEARVVER
jgi:hypothetical protein